MSPLHCPTCSSPLHREHARCGDPVLWCKSCEMGWLPGTHRFDLMLEAQHKRPEFPYLFQDWGLQDPPQQENARH